MSVTISNTFGYLILQGYHTYDSNGNMTKDGLNNLEVTYNYLNLPTVVRGGGGDVKVKYSYLADGTKIESVDDAGSGYAYIGSLVYRKSNADYELESVPFSAGRIEKTTSGYDISYHLTDQVGSVRAVINGVGEVQQQSDYYAFGLRHASTDFATNDNRYQLTGKESQKDFGFNYLDFHARQYDPTGILFTSQDPLQDKYTSLGSYNYCAGNPISYIDPDGKTIRVNQFTDNSKVIAYDWKEYDGKWGFYNSDNKLYAGGEDTFIGQLSGALTGLMEGGSTGHSLVSELANHSNVATISSRDASAAQGSLVGWNSTGVSKDGDKESVVTTKGLDSNPMINLGHELAHISYNWSVNISKTWFSMTVADDNGNPTQRPIPISEIYTIHLENRLRSENGLSLRTHYGIDTYGNGVGPRVIDRSEASRYYNSQGVTNFLKLKRKITPYTYKQ